MAKIITKPIFIWCSGMAYHSKQELNVFGSLMGSWMRLMCKTGGVEKGCYNAAWTVMLTHVNYNLKCWYQLMHTSAEISFSAFKTPQSYSNH